MKLIIHDLPENEADFIHSLASDDDFVVSNNGKIKPCMGCFDCWIKTPGECIIKNDGYNHIGAMYGNSDEIIVISECRYGAVSPFVKNVMDRSIAYILPYFIIRNGEMHHKMRYQNSPSMSWYLYGDINEEEKTTIINTINGNMLNLQGRLNVVKFYSDKETLKGGMK